MVNSAVSTARPTAAGSISSSNLSRFAGSRSGDRKSTCRAVRTPSSRVARPTAVQQSASRRQCRVVDLAAVPGGRGRAGDQDRATQFGQCRCVPGGPRRDAVSIRRDQRREGRRQVLHHPLMRVEEPTGDGTDPAVVQEGAESAERPEVGDQLDRVSQRFPATAAGRQLDAFEAGDRHRLQCALVVFPADEVVELGLVLIDRVRPSDAVHDDA